MLQKAYTYSFILYSLYAAFQCFAVLRYGGLAGDFIPAVAFYGMVFIFYRYVKTKKTPSIFFLSTFCLVFYTFQIEKTFQWFTLNTVTIVFFAIFIIAFPTLAIILTLRANVQAHARHRLFANEHQSSTRRQ